MGIYYEEHSDAKNSSELSNNCLSAFKRGCNAKEELIKNLSTTVQQLTREVEKKYVKYCQKFGLTAPQLFVIFYLKGYSPLSPAALSRKLGM